MDDLDLLVDDLRKLVSWGATAQRLPSLSQLRESLGVSPDIPYKMAGRIMRRALLAAIRDLSGTYTLRGREVSALQVRIALQILFRYDRWADSAPTRRVAAMHALGDSRSVRGWADLNGPESELLAILGESLMEPAVKP